MKRDKIIYWTTTGIVTTVMFLSAINFSLKDPYGPATSSFAHLGLPDYFKMELTVAKILGVLALVVPNIPLKVKEFAYFGFAITLISACIAHFASGDGIISLDPLIFLGILIISYRYFHKLNGQRVIAATR